MNVLREVFYWIKQKRHDQAASHLCGNGGRRVTGLDVMLRRNELRTWPNDDSALVSFERLFIDSRHLGIAGDDVTRAVISGQLDQDAAMLSHC